MSEQANWQEPLLVEPSENHSPKLGALALALAKAQLAFKPVLKESENPAFVRNGKASKYANLHSLISATQPALAANELVIIQSPSTRGKELVLSSLLLHSSGEWYSQELVLPAADERGFTAHSIGKAITYARRFSWQSLVGATAEEDDDGNSASGVGSKEAANAVAQQKIAELKAKKEDLAPILQASIDQQKAKKLNLPPVPAGAPKELLTPVDDDLFDEVSGTIQYVKTLKTSAAKGNRDYKKIGLTTIEGGRLVDREITSFENFVMSDGKVWDFLEHAKAVGKTTKLIVERIEKSGKMYFNLKDLKQLGDHQWEERLGIVERATVAS
jgi:ERF superfamily